jgi:hypothetical protein
MDPPGEFSRRDVASQRWCFAVARPSKRFDGNRILQKAGNARLLLPSRRIRDASLLARRYGINSGFPCAHIVHPEPVREVFKRIPKHGAGHDGGMPIQKPAFLLSGAVLPHFPQHPPNRFMNQILRILQEQSGDLQGCAAFSTANEVVGRQHCNSPFPKTFRVGEPDEHGRIASIEMSSNYVRCREIDQIPVIDAGSVGKIQVINGIPASLVSPPVLTNKDKERRQPFFMVWRPKQLPDISKSCLPVLLRNGPNLRNNDSEKPVSLPVFSWAGFEKAREYLRFSRIRHRP